MQPFATDSAVLLKEPHAASAASHIQSLQSNPPGSAAGSRFGALAGLGPRQLQQIRHVATGRRSRVGLHAREAPQEAFTRRLRDLFAALHIQDRPCGRWLVLHRRRGETDHQVKWHDRAEWPEGAKSTRRRQGVLVDRPTASRQVQRSGPPAFLLLDLIRVKVC